MICFDLDDVLNDFTRYCLDYLGYKGEIDPRLGRDIMGIANSQGGRYANYDEFWNSVDPGVWEHCPKSEHFDKLISWGIKNSGEKCLFILSAPVLKPGCTEAKIAWINKHWPWPNQVIITEHKYMVAKKGRILVDDYDMNILYWETFDGSGVLYPRPWNEGNYDFLYQG